MRQINKKEFFHICSGIGGLLIGTAIGIYLYTHFHGTESLLLILGITVYNVGVIGNYLITVSEGNKVTTQAYFSRILIWIAFGAILLMINWALKF